MLGIQSQPNVMTPRVAFRGGVSDIKYDIESERDEKVDQYTRDQADWNEFADNLENSNSKVAKKASKVVRFGAALIGVAAAFVGAKYGSRLTIETLKSLSKSKTAQSVIDGAKKMKEPAMKTLDMIKEGAKKVADSPAAKDLFNKVKSSKVGVKVGEMADELMKNEKITKYAEPLKNTINSIKDTKIDGKKIQNFVENAMAVTTTGSVIVDDLAGRNDEKSATELAAGV